MINVIILRFQITATNIINHSAHLPVPVRWKREYQKMDMGSRLSNKSLSRIQHIRGITQVSTSA